MKETLLNGLDDITGSLKFADKIAAFEKTHDLQLAAR